MKVVLNGRPETLPDGITVHELLARLGAPDRGVAVALDAEVVPRSQWDQASIGEGAHIEVVQAVQGG